MSYECFDVQIADHIAHVKLNRPEKRNAMNRAFWQELPAIIGNIDRQAAARVIVISSTGPHFSAGLDLSLFESNDTTTRPTSDGQRAVGLYNHILHMQQTFNCLENCRLPVLAAIQGGAIGGGVDLSTACDMRYATEDAFFVIQEINIALTADAGTFPRLVKLIPEGIVRELAYTGRAMSAREALQAGLVNQVFADQQQLLAGVMHVAQQIASKAPAAIYGSKRMINYARDHSTADALDYISIWNTSMMDNAEILEAIQAKAEGRDANFTDLPARQ